MKARQGGFALIELLAGILLPGILRADGSGPTNPTNPANIRKVTIFVTARAAYPDRAGLYPTITLMTDLTPRNLAS